MDGAARASSIRRTCRRGISGTRYDSERCRRRARSPRRCSIRAVAVAHRGQGHRGARWQRTEGALPLVMRRRSVREVGRTTRSQGAAVAAADELREVVSHTGHAGRTRERCGWAGDRPRRDGGPSATRYPLRLWTYGCVGSHGEVHDVRRRRWRLEDRDLRGIGSGSLRSNARLQDASRSSRPRAETRHERRPSFAWGDGSRPRGWPSHRGQCVLAVWVVRLRTPSLPPSRTRSQLMRTRVCSSAARDRRQARVQAGHDPPAPSTAYRRLFARRCRGRPRRWIIDAHRRGARDNHRPRRRSRGER